ncbi:hypothetical protein Sjap_005943 [Stephania japonica]|uniref:Uncharacterized protein n=1 Tax=Stephania japonica TaxID=461633 RepID=A0AAP0K7G6_9MAGN
MSNGHGGAVAADSDAGRRRDAETELKGVQRDDEVASSGGRCVDGSPRWRRSGGGEASASPINAPGAVPLVEEEWGGTFPSLWPTRAKRALGPVNSCVDWSTRAYLALDPGQLDR